MVGGDVCVGVALGNIGKPRRPLLKCKLFIYLYTAASGDLLDGRLGIAGRTRQSGGDVVINWIFNQGFICALGGGIAGCGPGCA